jgi:hypothetical protein
MGLQARRQGTMSTNPKCWSAAAKPTLGEDEPHWGGATPAARRLRIVLVDEAVVRLGIDADRLGGGRDIAPMARE